MFNRGFKILRNNQISVAVEKKFNYFLTHFYDRLCTLFLATLNSYFVSNHIEIPRCVKSEFFIKKVCLKKTVDK